MGEDLFINYSSTNDNNDLSRYSLPGNSFDSFQSYEEMNDEYQTPEFNYRREEPLQEQWQLAAQQPAQTLSQEQQSTDKENISLEDLIKQEKLPIRITSGFRGKGSLRGGKTAKGTRSNHNRLDEHGHSMAYDIVPIDGNFSNLKNLIYSNKRLLKWLDDRGYGVLDETDPVTMKKTGATGKHFHIGPDSSAVAQHQQNKDRFTMMARVGGILKMQKGGLFATYDPIKHTTQTLQNPSEIITADINEDRLLKSPKPYEDNTKDYSQYIIPDTPDDWDIPRSERPLNQQRQTTANKAMQTNREEFKQKLISFIKQHEGVGMSKIKGDRGGLTNTGITLATFKSMGTDKNGDGKIDDKDLALINNTDWDNIFTKNFWDKVGGDKIQDNRVLGQLVDWAWMSGGNAIKKARKALGLPESLVVDNQMIDIINNNPEEAFNKIKQARINHYTGIVEHNPSQSKFLKGWIKRVNDLV